MTTKTDHKKPTATEKRTKREETLRDQALAERVRRNAARVRSADVPKRADELYRLLRLIEKRAGDLFDLVHAALDTDNAAWLESYRTQKEVDSVQVDFIATPRDLNMLMCAVESNTPWRDVKKSNTSNTEGE